MKNKSIILILTLIIVTFAMLLTGCNALSDTKTPEDVIKDAFGDKSYTISFNSETLVVPIADLTYNASNIPTIRTPVKSGYIFEDWFFDRHYTEVFTKNNLLMKMSDVVLYPKWSKEEFSIPGKYAIDYSVNIMEETIKTGELTEEFGGIMDITNDIIYENSYIEKTDDSLLFKIQYDTKYFLPFGRGEFPYVVDASYLNYGNMTLVSRTEVLSDTYQTAYFDISKVDLSKPIYLDVTSYNWSNYNKVNQNIDDIEKIRVDYTIQIDIQRIIGFERPYEDTSRELDEGYYATTVSYLKINNGETMGSMFNSIDAYIHAEKGDDDKTYYKLIKPFNPYAGMAGAEDANVSNAYFSRGMTFCIPTTFAPITRPSDDPYENGMGDYFPSYIQAGQLGSITIEFHADEGRYYAIYDFGTELHDELMVFDYVTGYMEIAVGMAAYHSALLIDTDKLIRTLTIPYEPLQDSSYSFSDDFIYYPDNMGDFADKNELKSIIAENGVKIDLYNFFYTTTNASDIKSFRMTMTPSSSSAGRDLKDSRYQLHNISRNIQIFDYDVRQDELYADVFTTGFSDGGTALRQSKELVNGKTYNIGDVVNIQDIFYEKVNSLISFSQVDYTCYKIINGKVNYNTIIKSSKEFNFSQNMLIQFKFGDSYSTVEIVEYQSPIVKIRNTNDNTYNKYEVHNLNTLVNIPIVSYEWMGVNVDFYGYFYGEEIGVNPSTVGVGFYNGDIFSYANCRKNTVDFNIKTEKMSVYYQMYNKYGEFEYYILDFNGANKPTFIITNEDGDIVQNKSDVNYYNNSNDIRQISYKNSFVFNNIDYILNTKLYMTTYNLFDFPNKSLINMKSIGVYSPNYSIFLEESSLTLENILAAYNSVVGDSYFSITVIYENEICSYSMSYYAEIHLDNSDDITIFPNDDTVFADTEYIIDNPEILDKNGSILTEAEFTIEKEGYGVYDTERLFIERESINDNTFKIKFLTTGVYYINIKGVIPYLDGNIYYNKIEIINVVSDESTVSIKFITDEKHRFADGTLEKTIEFSLEKHVTLLDEYLDGSLVFEERFSSLFGYLIEWAPSLTSNMKDDDVIAAGYTIRNYINIYGTNNLTLYAFWDYGKLININYELINTGGELVFSDKYSEVIYYDKEYNEYRKSLNMIKPNFTASTLFKNYDFIGFYDDNGRSVTRADFEYHVDGLNLTAVYQPNYNVKYVINGYQDKYVEYLANGNFIKSSIYVSENDLIGYKNDNWDNPNLIENIGVKFIVNMADDYQNYMLSHYEYYMGGIAYKFDINNDLITRELDGADGVFDGVISLYAVYVSKATIIYEVTGYDNMFIDHVDPLLSLNNSVKTPFDSIIGNTYYDFSGYHIQKAHLTSKLLNDSLVDNYRFVSWGYRKNGKIKHFDIFNDVISKEMDLADGSNDNIIYLYAVFEEIVDINFNIVGYDNANNSYIDPEANNVISKEIFTNYSLLEQKDMNFVDMKYDIFSTDTTKKFSHWAYFNGKQLVEFDLYNDIIDINLTDDNRIIQLYAVFVDVI